MIAQTCVSPLRNETLFVDCWRDRRITRSDEFFPSLGTVMDVAIDIVANPINQPKAPNDGTRSYESTVCLEVNYGNIN